MPFVYRYIDLNKEEVCYVGKVTTYCDTWNNGLVKRHEQHKREQWYKKIGDENLLLQYIELPSHTDADILETWLINYYDTGQLENKAKLGWGHSSIDLYTAISGKWKNFRQGVISNKEEMNQRVFEIVNRFMLNTDGLHYTDEPSWSILKNDIEEIRNDMLKAQRLKSVYYQDDFLRVCTVEDSHNG